MNYKSTFTCLEIVKWKVLMFHAIAGSRDGPDLKSERKVLRLLAAGANNEAIARHMN
jgi:hypothetical protein